MERNPAGNRNAAVKLVKMSHRTEEKFIRQTTEIASFR